MLLDENPTASHRRRLRTQTPIMRLPTAPRGPPTLLPPLSPRPCSPVPQLPSRVILIRSTGESACTSGNAMFCLPRLTHPTVCPIPAHRFIVSLQGPCGSSSSTWNRAVVVDPAAATFSRATAGMPVTRRAPPAPAAAGAAATPQNSKGRAAVAADGGCLVLPIPSPPLPSIAAPPQEQRGPRDGAGGQREQQQHPRRRQQSE